MVYFLIPAYNEEDTVGLLLYKIREVMPDVRRQYLALVLDDGSDDATAKVAERYRKFLPLEVLRHRSNRGFGPSLDRLLREACRRSRYPQRDIAITLEGDFTWSPEPVADMVREIEAGADVVIGTRGHTDRPAEAMSRRRRLGSRIVSSILRAVMPVRGATDYTSTFRAYRISTLKRAIETHQETLITSVDGAANVEILLRLARLHPSIVELPAPCRFDIRGRGSRHRLSAELKTQLALTGRVDRAASH